MRRTVVSILLALGWIPLHAAAGLPYHALTEGNTPWHSLQLVRQAPAQPGKEALLAQLAAVAGDETLSCANRRRGPALEQHGRWRDALDVLEQAANGRRVVMLNENHERSRHRAFLLQLVERLHAQGVRALAAETFAAEVVASSAEGGVQTAAGVYTRDPVFASAVARALQLGWELVAYEAQTAVGDRQAREHAQARTLADWLQANPARRLLVYVGGSHLDKRADAGWMAAQLMAMTGIEPLSIRQGATACPADDPAQWPVPPATGVGAVVDSGREPTAEADWVVVHLPAADVEGRPGWLAALPGRQPLRLCLPSLPGQEPALLRVFAGDTSAADVIAADQFPLLPGQQRVTAWVAPGVYRIELEDAQGTRRPLGRVEMGAGQGSGCLSPQ